MTEIEAINEMNKMHPKTCKMVNGRLQGGFDDHESDKGVAFDMVVQALEKQIPKKPTPIDYEKYINVIDNARFLRGAYWCPNCKHVVKSGSFCSDCGQKLDWEV